MKYFYLFILCLLLFAAPFACGGGSGSSADLNLSAQNCGNGKLDAGEACDDGNANNSDSCNAHCAFEVGESSCGNGVLENDECCDDGNNVSGDGCSENCTLEKNNHPPTAPLLADEPHNMSESETGWAPTRLYLSWAASSDLDSGDKVSYDVYFILKSGRESIPPGILPYKAGISSTHFIIQASTDNRAEYFPDQASEIYLSPNHEYLWKVCARDLSGAQNCSETRTFKTDDSVVGWWRFEDQSCSVIEGPVASADQTICDYSGKGHHGRPLPIGSISILSSPNYKLLGKGADFDGQQSYVEIENSNELNLTELSIAGMYISRPSSITQRILTKLPAADPLDGYNLDLENVTGKVRFEICNQNFSPNCSGIRSNDSYLHNIIYRTIASYDGNYAKLFMNNYLEAEVSLSGKPVGINTHPLVIGKRPNDYFNGTMFDLILYDKPLTYLEVNNDYFSTQF